MTAQLIKMLMFSTTNILPFASLSDKINRKYCELYGYDFIHEQYNSVALEPQYEKVRVIQKHLASSNWVFWIDSDACVIDFSKRVEVFLPRDKDLVTSGHSSGFDLSGNRKPYTLHSVPAGLNTGVMILRNTPWSHLFLETWWKRCVGGAFFGSSFHEQGQLQKMLVDNTVDLQAHIDLITPASRLNRSDDNNIDVCEYILHLWGGSGEFRQQAFSEVAAGKMPKIGISMPNFDVRMG